MINCVTENKLKDLLKLEDTCKASLTSKYFSEGYLSLHSLESRPFKKPANHPGVTIRGQSIPVMTPKEGGYNPSMSHPSFFKVRVV